MLEAIKSTFYYWKNIFSDSVIAAWKSLDIRGHILLGLLWIIIILITSWLFSGEILSIPFVKSLIQDLQSDIRLVLMLLIAFAFLIIVNLFYLPADKDRKHYEEINKQKKSNSRLRRQLKDFKESSPRIVYDKFREGPQYITRKDDPTEVLAHYHILQIWFKNLPKNPSADAVAEKVSAEIEFCDSKLKKRLFNVVLGQWARTNAPTYISPLEIGDPNPKVDMQPGFLLYKLLVALKYPDDDECYPYAMEHFMGSYAEISNSLGKNPQMAIPKGKFLVRIRLIGVNAKAQFEFELKNPGAGETLGISPV